MSACPHCYDEDLLVGIKPAKPVQLAACRKCLDVCLVDWNTGAPVTSEIEGLVPLRELAPPGSVMAGVFSLLNDVIEELPVLPEIPQRIVSMINDPITSMSDLATIINEDAAISMKILRMSNSAFYASTHEITDLRTACARMGMKSIAHVVHAVANGNLYRARDRAFRDIMEQLWRHAVATAHCADELAGLVRGIDRNLPFAAGLVHDVGKLVLLDLLTTKYKGNIGRLRESPQLLIKVIDRFYTLVGLHVVQFWQMTPEYTFTTFFNSQPAALSANPVQQWKSLTHLVALAGDVATACGYKVGPGETPSLQQEHPSAVALGLSDEQIGALHLSLPEPLEALMEVLGAP